MASPEFNVTDQVLGVQIENRIGTFFLGALSVLYNHKPTEHLLIYTGLKSPVPLRIQSGCMTGHVAGDRSCECKIQMSEAMHYIEARSNGLIIYTPEDEGRGRGLLSKLKVYKHRLERSRDSQRACQELGLVFEQRDFRLFPNLLKHLEITSVIALSSNMDKILALKNGGIDVRAKVPL